MNDLQRAGGIPALMQEIRELIHPEALTINGRTICENIEGSEVLDPLSRPINEEGGIAVLKGNLAEEGALIKQSAVAPELRTFQGPARVFNSEEDFVDAYDQGILQEGEAIVIRYEGPKGGLGMRELHRCTELLGKFKRAALITDGRFSGASAGLSIGYLSPEAAEGGTIALVQDGDIIEIDVPNRQLTLQVSNEKLADRREKLELLKKEASKFLKLYSSTTTSAARGAVRV